MTHCQELTQNSDSLNKKKSLWKQSQKNNSAKRQWRKAANNVTKQMMEFHPVLIRSSLSVTYSGWTNQGVMAIYLLKPVIWLAGEMTWRWRWGTVVKGGHVHPINTSALKGKWVVEGRVNEINDSVIAVLPHIMNSHELSFCFRENSTNLTGLIQSLGGFA